MLDEQDSKRRAIAWFVDDAEASLWTEVFGKIGEHSAPSGPRYILGRKGVGLPTLISHSIGSLFVHWHSRSAEKEPQQPSGYLFPMESVDPNRSDPEHLRIENTQLLIERERFKTQLLVAQRDLLEERECAKDTQASADGKMARLLRQNDGQLDCIRDLSRANAALQQAMINRSDGRLAMHEHNSGVVVDCVDDHVAIRYETNEGPIEQIYHVNQFARGQVPKPGDRIEAHVFAWRREHEPKGIEHYLTPEEIEHAREAFEKGTTGPVES